MATFRREDRSTVIRFFVEVISTLLVLEFHWEWGKSLALCNYRRRRSQEVCSQREGTARYCSMSIPSCCPRSTVGVRQKTIRLSVDKNDSYTVSTCRFIINMRCTSVRCQRQRTNT